MASLSTCHRELVVWGGNLVKKLSPEGPRRARPRGEHIRVICLHRITTVLPSSGSRLKKIADNNQNVTRRKR